LKLYSTFIQIFNYQFIFKKNSKEVVAFILNNQDIRKYEAHKNGWLFEAFLCVVTTPNFLYSVVFTISLARTEALSFADALDHPIKEYTHNKELAAINLEQIIVGECKATLFIEGNPHAWCNEKWIMPQIVGERFVLDFWKQIIDQQTSPEPPTAPPVKPDEKPRNLGGKPRYESDEWARKEVEKGRDKKDIRREWQERRKKEMEDKYSGEPADWSETFRKVFVLPPENRKIPEDT
jgi:hypothetical protein